jgi:hypothetical protein
VDVEGVQKRLDLAAAVLVVGLLLFLLFGGFSFGSHHHGHSAPEPTLTTPAPAPPGGKCPPGKVAVTIGDETGNIGHNTTAEELAATVSGKLQITVTAAELSAKNPGLIRHDRTTAGFNGDQCLNY